MAGVNKAIILGRLGRDPEKRELQGGGSVVTLRIATNETWKDKNGERHERTEWHQVVVFNEKLGEVAARYLRKGSEVYVEGQLQTRKWTGKDGAERYSTEIVLQKFGGALALVGGRPEGGVGAGAAGGDDAREPEAAERPPPGREAGGRAAAGQRSAPDYGRGGALAHDHFIDDDIPF